ncbi:hypothetical protein P691DRAFT_673969, partial [Macrolepiota fuliginosa MF-IS2]
TLYLITNKQTRTKLREEITPILIKNPRPEYRTLKELEWLDRIVSRVLPPVSMTIHQAAKTDYINRILTPQGTILYVPYSRVINTWTTIWGPEHFRPCWLNLPKIYHSQCSLMSFIVDPHACIRKTDDYRNWDCPCVSSFDLS